MIYLGRKWLGLRCPQRLVQCIGHLRLTCWNIHFSVFFDFLSVIFSISLWKFYLILLLFLRDVIMIIHLMWRMLIQLHLILWIYMNLSFIKYFTCNSLWHYAVCAHLFFILTVVKNLIVFKGCMRFVSNSILNTHYLAVLSVWNNLIAFKCERMSTSIGSCIDLLDYSVNNSKLTDWANLREHRWLIETLPLNDCRLARLHVPLVRSSTALAIIAHRYP